MVNDTGGRLITSIERAAEVLTLFTTVDSPDLGVTEIATQLGLSKAVVHRVLTTLSAKGFIEADGTSRRYRLGPMVLALGVTYLARIDLRSLAVPRLKELSARTRETATFSLRHGTNRIYVDQVTPDREVKMEVVLGQPFPLHAGSSSKAFLAFLPSDEQERYLSGQVLDALTDRTITDPEVLRSELSHIREWEAWQHLSSSAVATQSRSAPVFNHRSEPVAAISVCGPLERFVDAIDEVAEQLVEATTDLSRQLGYGPPHDDDDPALGL
jgi:IclR family transcriptional regulator, acetate operon repressor